MSDHVCAGGDLYPVDRLHEKALRRNIPILVYLELTYSCNERCAFCYNPQDRVTGLTAAQLRRPLKELAEMGGFYLNLTGGEPLLHPEFFEIAETAAALGYALRLLTNGTLIGPHNIDRLCALPFTGFEISIHSADPEAHDAITGLPGSFHKMLNGVRMLRERDQRVVWKMPVTRVNQGEIARVETLARKWGCELRTGSQMTPTHDFRRDPLEYSPDPRSLVWHYEKAFTDPHGRLLTIQPYDKTQPNCTLGRSMIAVAPNGDIHPCITMPVRLGNVLTDSVRAIWENPTLMRPFRENVRSRISPCRSCAIAQYCSFCPGIAYLQYRNLARANLEACLDAQGFRQVYRYRVTEIYMRGREPLSVQGVQESQEVRHEQTA